MSVGAVNKQTGDRIPTAGMPAIDDALDLTSVNPVQNDIITAALANKQDKTDNSLQTTSKTVVGGINELKSGLTNVDVALSVPENSGKNVLPLTLANLKAINIRGTWDGNTYTIYGVVFTVQIDSNGNVTSIVANGTATDKIWFRLVPTTFDIMNGTILSGITNGSRNTFSVYALESNDTTVITQLTSGEYTFTNNYENVNMYINILSGVAVDNITFYPMLRPATITDPTFAPYIPSVESRIEAVESGLYGRKLLFETASTGTYADKLDSIFAVFNDLTESQKMRACITYYSTVLTMSTSPNFSSLPYYESDDNAPRGYSAMLKNSGSTLYKFVYGASGTTVTDMSAQTANTTLKLYLLS